MEGSEILDLARQDRPRYLCALSAPLTLRQDVLTLLAFDQEISRIPSLVSEPALGRIRLQWWIDTLSNKAATAHPLAGAVLDLKLDSERLCALIEARNAELDGVDENIEAQVDYAHSTHGAFQQMVLDVLGVDDASSRQAAGQIGTAWGLVKGHAYDANRWQAAQGLLGQARELKSPITAAIPTAMPGLILARLVDRHLRRGVNANIGSGAIMSLWWGKFTGQY